MKYRAGEALPKVSICSTKAMTVSNQKKAIRQLPTELPMGLFLHLTGVMSTIKGQPVDLGFPGGIDLDAANRLGLLD